MHTVDQFYLPPGCCMICRSDKHLPAVDLIRDIDELGHEGRAYICRACGVEVGGLFGMDTPEASKARDLDLAEAVEDAGFWQDRAVKAETALAAIDDAVADIAKRKASKKKAPAKRAAKK